MPLGKRGFKRPASSSSYTSTVTTIIFIALCVLGVWMLTTNTIAPTQTTTVRTSTTGDSKTTFSATNEPEETAKPAEKKPQAVFEDNPGEIPEDAIKADKNEREQAGKAAGGGDSREESKVKEKDSVVDKNAMDLQGKESVEEQEKQKESEIQISEESTLTQKQQAEQTDLDQKSNNNNEEKNGNDQDPNAVAKSGDSTLQMLPNQSSVAGDNAAKEQRKEEIQNKLQEQQQEQHQQQQQIKQESQISKMDNKLDQNDKSSDDMIKQQLQEDAGNQTVPRVTQNENQGQQIPQTQETKPNFPDVNTQFKPSEQEAKDVTKTENLQNPLSTSEKTQQTMTTAAGVDPNIRLPDQNQENKPQQQEEVKQERMEEHKTGESNSSGSILGGNLGGNNPGIPQESVESKKSWKTQATQSLNEKERRKDESDSANSMYGYAWHLCNETAGPDYIPCLDNEKAISKLPTTQHFEHRERHCPELGPTCLVPLPKDYKRSIPWPASRDKIWYSNVPNTKLAEVKGHQNWVKVDGEHLTFPGGGTQFIHGALHYIAFIQESVPNITWGKHIRVVLDVGCGVASFGGYLFDRDVLTMSFAPKDEHEAQVQFALERGIPAISAVMGSQRLPFPSRVFDLIHCARCRVPWHEEGGRLLLELNRVLRPGGYFAWSATPVYQTLEEDVQIWRAMTSLTKRMCWELVTIKKDKINSAGMAVYRKPTNNICYGKRKHKTPPLCKDDEDPNAAWYVPLQLCMHRLPVESTERGSRWPEEWPLRLQMPPYWLNSSQNGIYGKPAPQDFEGDYEHWKRVVSTSYMSGLGISWSNVRNVMDMRAVYGGFAAALKEVQVWVMNVVNVDSPDTLPIIYERGLFGIYHDWCESFSTYPRTYDLLHADHLFSKLKKRCKLAPVLAEVDRIVRPGGKLIVRDESTAISEVENLLKSLRWEVHLTFSKDQEGILSAQKGDWRPDTYQNPSSS